jgi:hypothetical protein
MLCLRHSSVNRKQGRGLRVTELAVGTSTLEVPTDEIAELYAELVRRAA